jgi:hypothetical protein
MSNNTCLNEELAYLLISDSRDDAVSIMLNNTDMLRDAVSSYIDLGCESNTATGTCKQLFGVISRYYSGETTDNNPYGILLPENLRSIAPNKTMLTTIRDIKILEIQSNQLYQQYLNCKGNS